MFFSLVLGLTDIFISSLLLFGFLPPSSLCLQSSHVALILVFTPCPRVNMAWAAKGQRGRTRDGYPTFLQPVGVCGSASCLCSVPHRIVAQQVSSRSVSAAGARSSSMLWPKTQKTQPACKGTGVACSWLPLASDSEVSVSVSGDLKQQDAKLL